MATEFTPLFLFILLAIFGIAAGMILVSAVLGPRRRTAVKQMPYESGMDPIGDTHQRFDVRFYLVAITFLLFDVELLFLYPWAVAQWSRDTATSPASAAVVAAAPAEPGPAGAAAVAPVTQAGFGIPSAPGFRNLVFLEILVFIVVLGAAYAYAWRKGVFQWR